MANRTVPLVRNCKTEKGWRRYPVAYGKDGRLRPGWVTIGEEPEYFEQCRHGLRFFEGSRLVDRPAGETPAEAQAARDQLERKLAARISAAEAGILLPEDEAERSNLARKAQEFVRDAERCRPRR